MIVLNVTYKCKPGKREAFLGAIKSEGLDASCRAEAGNRKYDYYMAADAPDEMVLLEKWVDADALAIHYKEPHFLRIGELKNEYVEETVIEKFVMD